LRLVDKVYAYVTHDNRLLVFQHVGIPEAGWQVPGGTVEPGEAAEAAVLREIGEETGLSQVALVRPLGMQMREMQDFGRDEVPRRHFFHLRVMNVPPERWQHLAEGRYTFDFTWATLPDSVPPLIADLGALLPALRAE
jgi:8-oxo-dGTP pyrophosphatase MutT (NUDIX family)